MIRLTEEHIIELHRRLIERTGGDPGIRDMAALSSAVNAPFQTFMGELLHPSYLCQGAALGYYLIKNHPFVDGNKRVGMLAMLVFMGMNGDAGDASSEEIAAVGWGIAKGELDREHIIRWLMERSWGLIAWSADTE